MFSIKKASNNLLITCEIIHVQLPETQEGSILTRRNIQESELDAFEGAWCDYLVSTTSND